MPQPISARTTGRSLIPDPVFQRLAGRLAKDHGLDTAYAARIVDQTGAFLKACADNPDTALSPSMAVDLGWHAFILHTADYAAFCRPSPAGSSTTSPPTRKATAATRPARPCERPSGRSGAPA